MAESKCRRSTRPADKVEVSQAGRQIKGLLTRYPILTNVVAQQRITKIHIHLFVGIDIIAMLPGVLNYDTMHHNPVKTQSPNAQSTYSYYGKP